MNIKEIKTSDPFKSLFPVNDIVYTAILENMENNGYDYSQPIIIWKDKNIIIDGHTRHRVAVELDLKDIPTFEKIFKSEEDALQYAIHNQRDRRNLTDDQIISCVDTVRVWRKDKLDNLKQNQPETPNPDFRIRPKLEPYEPTDNRTSQKIADMMGVSRDKVDRTLKVIDNATPEQIESIKDGNKSINKVYTEIREEEIAKKEESIKTFNQTNDNIEWAKWTWNPVTGCKHGCPYCYARDIANRFYKEGFEPTFHEERLEAPKSTKIPKSRVDEVGITNVFVCSMADLFGEWVPIEWIEKVFKSIEENPDWNFILLTKNPKRYLELDIPDNCWIGATADIQERTDEAIKVFTQLKNNGIKNTLFLSCEPLSENIINIDSNIDWLIIGGRSKCSNMSEAQPEWKWVENLLNQAREANIPIYFKPNLTVRPKEYPEV
jgi:protein gp37